MASPQGELAEAQGDEIKLPTVPLGTLLTEVARRHADRPALICRHQPPHLFNQGLQPSPNARECLRWTHADLYVAAHSFASKLSDQNVRTGMRIAAFLRNGAQYAIGIYAAALLGCTFVPINSVMIGKKDAVQHMLSIAEASVLMVWDDKMAAEVDEAMDQKMAGRLLVKIICNRSETSQIGWVSMEELVETRSQRAEFIPDMAWPESNIDDLALIIFTSGTTSQPKGVKQTHRTLVTGIRSSAQLLALDEERKFCNNLPLFHIFGIMYTLNFWSCGGAVCFPAESFQPEAALRAIEKEKLTNLAGVPTMMQAIINQRSMTKSSTDSLLHIIVSGSMVLPETIRQIREGLGTDRISANFGMSESIPVTSIPYHDLPYEYSGTEVSSGKCSPGVRIRICAPDSHTVLERGAVGELHVGGPMVTEGYLGNVSGPFYYDDGCRWMSTGDQAVLKDNSELFVLGRYKDLIIRAGENISPASIEAVLDTVPNITSQVVGVQDEVAGEVPFAVVKLTEDTETDIDRLRTVVTERLGPLYAPAEFADLRDLGLDEFPKTESGKIQKVKLRDYVDKFINTRDNSHTGSQIGDPSSQDILHQIWSDLVGRPKDKLDVNMSLHQLVDSITIMRAINKIRQQIGHTFTVKDIMEYPSIKAQAERCSCRSPQASSGPEDVEVTPRDGPPTVDDVSPAIQDPGLLSKIQDSFQALAGSMGLSWEQDVEDVIPIWDFGQVLLRRLRAHSWNHRHAFVAAKASPAELRSALETALSNSAMMRTMAVEPANAPPMHVVIRPSSKWFDLVFTEVEAVRKADDLKTLLMNDPSLDYAAAPGPLFRAIIVPIVETGTSGLVYTVQHSCFDGISIPNMLEDVRSLLSGRKDVRLPQRTSYKKFADTLFLYRNSVPAHRAIDYHVKRLRGIGKLEKALFPIQRAPEWFKGNFSDTSESLIKSRPILDGDKAVGVDGIIKRTQLPHLQKMQSEKGVSPPAMLKSALALLNSYYTKQPYAIYTNYEAGREWPFVEPWLASLLPNAMDVNGPSLEAVLNVIPIDSLESCEDMVRRVNYEQTQLSRNAHAPLFAIQESLGEEDGKGMVEMLRRQIFNWLPGLKGLSGPNNDSSPLRRIQMQSRSDVGMLWNCGLLDHETFQMNASYDDAQLRKTEVEEMVDRLFQIADWITDPDNWSKGVGECPALR